VRGAVVVRGEEIIPEELIDEKIQGLMRTMSVCMLMQSRNKYR
jgi:hypothetical protein